MAILIETMRREGFELSVGRPQVIYKRKDGVLLEPIEHLFIDCGRSTTPMEGFRCPASMA